jgi:hypothetical protein
LATEPVWTFWRREAYFATTRSRAPDRPVATPTAVLRLMLDIGVN